MDHPPPEVILPCLDESAALPAVLSAVHEVGLRPLVVDNGSRDDSTEVAEAHGATVVHEPRRGYGAAVHTGLENASAEFVCMLDADGSIDPRQLPKLLEPLREGHADLVVGRREPVNRQAWSWHARTGNAVVAAVLRRRGVRVRDLGPVRVCRREALLGLDVQDRAFGYPLEVLLRASRAGWRLREIPVRYEPRASGTKSKVTGTVRGTARTVRDMIGVLR